MSSRTVGRLAVGAIAVLPFWLCGCATNSGVVPISAGTYVVSRQAATGFSGMGNLRVEALQEAGQQCERERKTLRIIDERQSQPPYILGNFPRIDLTFACDPTPNP